MWDNPTHMEVAQGSGIGFLKRAWRIGRWMLLVLVLGYIALAVIGYFHLSSKQKTADAVAAIKAQRLTLADADGSHLPPAPDPKQVDATVAGVDANGNGIRDDVELAIFKLYPNSPYTRAAELQYAMTEQMFLIAISSSETWVAAAVQDSRGYACISQTVSRANLTTHSQVVDQRTGEVKSLVFNTEQRQAAKQSSDKYTTTFSLPDRDFCDVDAGQLKH
jgi:hypothetical protein